MTFADLGLSDELLRAVTEAGYDTPTPIQAQAIPPVLEGRDLMGIAQTGTGKTAAFMLPSIDRLREADKQTPFKSCRMLVLAPTRELAGQIAQNAKDYGALAGLKVQCIVGGTSVGKDRNKLHRGTDILVATPGRLLSRPLGPTFYRGRPLIFRRPLGRPAARPAAQSYLQMLILVP